MKGSMLLWKWSWDTAQGIDTAWGMVFLAGFGQFEKNKNKKDKVGASLKTKKNHSGELLSKI